MWFLGLIAGAIVGAIGGGGGALVGAIVGAIVGGVISSQRRAAADERLKTIEDAIRQLHQRVKVLEGGAAPAMEASSEKVAGTDGEPAATAQSPEQHAPVAPEAPPIPMAARADLEGLADVIVTPAKAAPTPQPQEMPEPVPVPAAEAVAAAEAPATEPPALPPSYPWAPSGPAQPSWWSRVIAGNIVARVGVVVLFFGVAFLLKFAYDHGFMPVPLRLAGVALAGLAMIYGGWRLQPTRRLYGLILQGGGFGLLYLDVFFALKVFTVLHPTPAFALFMAIGVAMTLAAVRNDAKPLAVLGLVGAFLAPILAGSREGNHVLLFSYYTVLNGFILAVSWFKAWRDLNLVGFLFTFVVGLLWGAHNYRPELFGTVEPFVLVFFAMYLVIPILFAHRQPPELKGLVDGTLVFGTPMAVAFMQAALVQGMPHGLSVSAGCATLLYAVLAAMTIRRAGMRLLGETYIALSVVFLTLAIFFAFGAYLTFALWTLEGAAIVWVGLRQQRLLARLFGYAVQFAGAAYFLMHYADYDLGYPWFNDFVLGCALIAVASWVTAWLMHRHREVLIEGGEAVAAVILLWGCLWWFAGGLHAVYHGVPRPDFVAAALAFGVPSFALAEIIGAGLGWRALRLVTALHLPALVLALLFVPAAGLSHPLAGYGGAAWPLAFAVYYWCLHRQQRDGVVDFHAACYRSGWVVMALVATWEVVWQLEHRRYPWALAWSALGFAVGYLRFHLRERDNAEARPLSAVVLAWAVFFWFVSGLGYIAERLDASAETTVALGFAVLSCAAFELRGAAWSWRHLRGAANLLAPALTVAVFAQFSAEQHPFAGYGWLAWPAGFVAWYAVLMRQERDAVALAPEAQHPLALWLAVGVLAWELAWQLDTHGFGDAWSRAVWGVIPAAALGWVSLQQGGEAWPFGQRFDTYRPGLLPIAIVTVIWSLYANLVSPGSAEPLPYLPLLFPVDVAQAVVIWALVRWSRTGGAGSESSTRFPPWIAPLVFLWVNCIVLRSIHYWAGVDYEVDALLESVLVQSAFSLLWTATALVLMLHATRSAQRNLWIVGAALLGVVVIKLFVNDLGNTGTVARIVSFLGVGALLMVIGYVAPVPPGEQESSR